MKESIKIPVHIQIDRAKGTQDNSCDFCLQKNKDGFIGNSGIKDTELVEPPATKIGSRRGPSTTVYLNALLVHALKKKDNAARAMVCYDCVKEMYKNIK